MFGVLGNDELKILNRTKRTPELKTPGFLFDKGNKMTKIDYTKLNEQIVKQAYKNIQPFVLSADDTRKLISDKFERARQFSEALQKSPIT